MSINELQDLVIGALQVEDGEDAPVKEERRSAEIFFQGTRDSVSYELFLSDAKDTLKNLDSLTAEEILYRVSSLAARSQLLTLRNYSFPQSSVKMLYHAIDFQEGGDGNNLNEIRAIIEGMISEHGQERRRDSIRDAVASREKVLDILEAVWGDDTENNITEITNVKRATVKRWLAGANIGSSSFNLLHGLAKILHVLREEKGYDRDALLLWYDTELSDGVTPRQAFITTTWGVPSSIRQLMTELDVSYY